LFDLSIIIPAYRAELTLNRAINSVLDQESINAELIVVEDGVFDGTASVVEQYVTVKHVQFEKNQGACHARNHGLAMAQSDYVMFLDADDYLEGDTFLLSMLKVIKQANSSIVLGKCKRFWEESESSFYFTPPENEHPLQLAFRWLCGQSGPPPCSVLWNKQELQRIGGWNEDYSKNQDGELMLRAMFNGCTLSQNYDGTGVYVHHSGERVSGRIDNEAFHCLSRIEEYVKSQTHESDLDFSVAIATYQLQVGLRALNFNRPDIGQVWFTKWSNSWSAIGLSQLRKLTIKYMTLNVLCMLFSPHFFVKLRRRIKGVLAK
jgi:glycosyltransferase involved in cell wall biosynthesis